MCKMHSYSQHIFNISRMKNHEPHDAPVVKAQRMKISELANFTVPILYITLLELFSTIY